MARDEDKLIRQLSLLAFLLSRSRPCTAREVHECVEGYGGMSEDTFTRRFYADRADLAQIGIDIKVLECPEAQEPWEKRLYYLPEDEFRLPEVQFTPQEARALSLALAALEGRFAYSRPLRLALTALLRGQHDPSRAELERLPIAVAPDEDAQRAGQQLARLEDALLRGKTVSFLYRGSDGSTHTRTLDPYSLFHIQGHWYVVGRDHLRDDIRSFRVGRIVGPVSFVTSKARDFVVPPDYDPEQYRARPPWLLGPVEGAATIRLPEELAWLAERLEPHVTRLGDNKEGEVSFLVPYADEKVLLSWVVGLGNGDALVGPPELRRRFHDLLLEVGRLHGEILASSAVAPASPTVEPSQPRKHTPGASGEQGPTSNRKAAAIAPERLARALTLLSYLLDEGRPSFVPWESLAADLGLSREEVEADLSVINLVNFGGGTYAISAEAERDGVRVVRDVMAEAFSRPVRLSPMMAQALLLAFELLGDTLPLVGLDVLSQVREKIKAVVTSDQSPRVIIEDVTPLDKSVVDALNQAITERRVVELEYYHATRRELVTRTVEPYLLFHSPQGWYLEAYCLVAKGQRTFKLDRIRRARATDTIFAPRPEVDLGLRSAAQPYSPSQAVTWAQVRFRPELRNYLEDQGYDYAPRPDGWLEARLPCASQNWLALEIVRHLGDAVVEAPVSACERVYQLALLLASRYAAPAEHGVAGQNSAEPGTGNRFAEELP